MTDVVDQNDDNAANLDDGAASGNDGDTGEGQRTFTQDELNSFLAKERRESSEKARSEYLASLGVESEDDIKALLDAKREQEEGNKTAQERLAEFEAQHQALSGQLGEYEGVVSGLLEAQLEAVPEDRRGLIPDSFTAVQKLDYINRNRELLLKPVSSGPVGSGSQPAPDASNTDVSYEKFISMDTAGKSKFFREFPDVARSYAQRARGL